MSSGGYISAGRIKEMKLKLAYSGRITMGLFTSHFPLKSGIGIKRPMFKERDIRHETEFLGRWVITFVTFSNKGVTNEHTLNGFRV